MFTLETCTIAKAAARGAPIVANYSSSAIGMNSANGISKTVSVDPAVTKSPAFSNSNGVIGAREGCQFI